jgi:hypothetical protein
MENTIALAASADRSGEFSKPMIWDGKSIHCSDKWIKARMARLLLYALGGLIPGDATETPAVDQ